MLKKVLTRKSLWYRGSHNEMHVINIALHNIIDRPRSPLYSSDPMKAWIFSLISQCICTVRYVNRNMFMASSSESEERCSCRCLQTSDCRSTSYPLLSHGPTLEIFLRATLFLPESFRNYLLLFRVLNLHLLLLSLLTLLRWMMHVYLFTIGKGKLLRDAFVECIFFVSPQWGFIQHENFAYSDSYF